MTSPTPLLAATAPIFKVAGNVQGQLARDVTRLDVEEDTGGMKKLMLRLGAQGYEPGQPEEELLYLNGSILDFGKELQVSVGPAETARTIFDGYISALQVSIREAEEPEVTVFAEDRLMRLRTTRRMKTYEKMKDSDIAQQIASANSISAQADADGPAYDVVQQWNQSDLAFLRSRGRLIQAEVWIQDNTLHFQSRSGRSGTQIELVQGNTLIAVEARADLAHQRTKITVSGYDASSRDVISEDAGSSVVAAEVTTGRTGVAVMQQAFGARVSYRVREVPLTTDEATAFAKAEMLRRARAFVTVTGMTSGTAEMVVGSQISLQRVGTPFEGGGYYATHVRHTWDLTDGFRTHFTAERATIQEGS
jgi:phage protein D